MLRSIFSNSYAKVREINDKYKTPGIEMSGGVKFALLALRLYLIALIGLSLYKFITLLK
ncbi:MAG: hypothetical protein M0Z75_05510 [Nitrospiraceae bacterium]|nr:hypothetical protein [Nitrospiraceae bacterium]